jgi:hypothetical protein
MTNLRALTSARRWVNILGKGLGLMVLGLMLGGQALATFVILPDLTATWLEVASWTDSRTGWIQGRGKLKIENLGEETPSEVEVKIYLSDDGTALTQLLRTVTIAPLAAGGGEGDPDRVQ